MRRDRHPDQATERVDGGQRSANRVGAPTGEVGCGSSTGIGVRRVVALPETVVAALRAHRKVQNEERLRLGADYLDTPASADLVFRTALGAWIRPEAFSCTFNRRVARADLPKTRLHDLRHTFATLALEAAVPLKVVSDILGHSTIGITCDLYTHRVPAMEQAATAKVAALIAGASE